MDNTNIPAHTSQVVYAGPVQLLTPPLSDSSESQPQRERLRQCNRSSSSEDEPIPVREEPEIKREDHRVGGPVLCRLPAATFPITSADPITHVFNSELRDKIMEAIQESNIDFQEMSVFKRRWRESRDKPLPVILIIAKTRRNRPIDGTWFQLCQKIRAFCVSAGRPEVNVEIGDPAAYIPIISSAVLSSDPIVQHWPTLRPQILKIINGRMWLTLDVLRRGPENSEGIITIVITIPECSTSDAYSWRPVRDKIVNVINTTGLENVAVEIGRGAVYTSDDIDNNFFNESDPCSKAHFGGSLAGLHDSKRLGTFGGFIVLDFPDGKSRTCGLTCYHCVVNDDIDSPALETWEMHGLRPNDPKNNIELSHPCRRDYDDIISHYKDAIAKIQTPEYFQMLSVANDPDGFLIPSQRRYLDYQLKNIDAYEKRLQFANEFMSEKKNYLGKVYAGSGLRLNEDMRSLDWALIDVSPQRVTGNKLPDGLLSGHFNPTSQGGLVTDAKFEVMLEQKVFKIGRSTGFTRGIVNGLETTKLRSWTFGGPSGDTPIQKCGIEWSIVPDNSKDSFSARGDSGAFVLDDNAHMVGLVFAGNTYCTTTYMTPVAAIFEDIKKITGACGVRVFDDMDD
ncbi:TPA_exp: Uncharacterized protein A8136_2219 [Trichophyton benhamiae CBS 112371]|uniref:Uncharacterized protein n=1 Tax=Arthroderma benhamiae (strain ATCC MYA-4681 / CBS 112371) TaxID=663331 RepID=D4AYJ7_ARTBC|nr:uncharacterized protein ARB_01266 [Trichophyton benhamiae CBS 112371]EFE31667.1 hypothetical protein ARB_01266 [Trichophyton benhamiae CBS 112371]DAA74801.1 TPA_exp: Uncharacterized protein A8136_2219 [Trichophyton benhamiae CBS 112371]